MGRREREGTCLAFFCTTVTGCCAFCHQPGHAASGPPESKLPPMLAAQDRHPLPVLLLGVVLAAMAWLAAGMVYLRLPPVVQELVAVGCQLVGRIT